MWARVRGEQVRALVVRWRGRAAIYAQLDAVTAVIPAVAQAASLSIFCHEPLIMYGSEQRELNIPGAWRLDAAVLSRDYEVEVHEIVAAAAFAGGGVAPFDEQWPDLRITATHHTLTLPSEACRAASGARVTLLACALARLRSVRDAHRAFVAGVLLWCASARVELVHCMLSSARLWDAPSIGGLTVQAWAKSAKALTSVLKAHRHYDAVEWNQMFELDVLVNRGIGSVDWEAEREHRVRPDIVEMDERDIYDRAIKIFRQGRALGYEYKKETWSAYWARRWASTPTGSMHSQYAEDQVYVDSEYARRTKFFSAIKMPTVPLAHFTGRRPEIVAWPSTKYEWGKQRAIYGTDYTSYVLTDFVMPAIEESLSHAFPLGRMAAPDRVRQRVALLAVEGIPVCFDYEDFNSQHSLVSQYAVVKAYLDAYEPFMSRDQQEAAHWVLSSVLAQRVLGPKPYTSQGTLLSGWRLTTVVNTVLNKVYLDAAGSLSVSLDSVHNGDDVLAYVRTLKDAQVFFARATGFGIRAQVAKCVTAGIGEFLRVDTRSEDANTAQYLTRGIATAVHSRVETRLAEDVVSALEAQETRIAELEARGVDAHVAAQLRSQSYRNLARVYSSDVADVRAIRDIHRVHGGMSDHPETPIVGRVVLQTEQSDEEEGLIMSKLAGVQAYAGTLAAQFKMGPEVKGRIVLRLGRATARSVSFLRRKLSIEPILNLGVAKNEQFLHRIAAGNYAVETTMGKADRKSVV